VGELAAQPGVFVGGLVVALEGDGEPGTQRGAGCPLPGGDVMGRVAAAGAA
jgi:hypothetical protein